MKKISKIGQLLPGLLIPKLTFWKMLIVTTA